MGYEILEKKSKAELAKIIRNTAKDTKTVIITIHVGARMRERKISAPEVYENLRLGTIRQEPEPNVRKGSLECRMERYIAGRNIAVVVVALCDEDPDVIVVTAFTVD